MEFKDFHDRDCKKYERSRLLVERIKSGDMPRLVLENHTSEPFSFGLASKNFKKSIQIAYRMQAEE